MQQQSHAVLPPARHAAFVALHEGKMLGAHETTSGAGSTLMATFSLRRALGELLRTGMFGSLLDVGCGDFNWMQMLNLHGADYIGIDIVPSLVAENRKRWPQHRFDLLDIVESAPPPCDLALCKDLFTHFLPSDVMAALANIRQSGARFLAATNYYPSMVKAAQVEYYAKHTNSAAGPGYWRPTALCEAPFFFPAPMFSIPLNQNAKTLDIWAMEDVPAALTSNTHNPSMPEDFARYEFFRRLCALPFVKKISLYGSRSRGDWGEDSDIDLLLECNPLPTRREWLEVCDIIAKADVPLEIDCKLMCDTLPSVLQRMNEFYEWERVLYHAQ